MQVSDKRIHVEWFARHLKLATVQPFFQHCAPPEITWSLDLMLGLLDHVLTKHFRRGIVDVAPRPALGSPLKEPCHPSKFRQGFFPNDVQAAGFWCCSAGMWPHS